MLAEFIGSPHLPVGRVFKGPLHDSLPDFRGYPILDAGLPSGLRLHPFERPLLIGLLAVKEILAGTALDLAGCC